MNGWRRTTSSTHTLTEWNSLHQSTSIVAPAQDVYTEVAALVRERVAADAAAGNQWAALLHDAIDRKLVGACLVLISIEHS